MPRAPKKRTQNEHAKRRARQRLGLGSIHLAEACKQIRHGKARHLLTQTRRVGLFLVATDGIRWVAAYDNRSHQICTCLTVEMVAERWPELRPRLG